MDLDLGQVKAFVAVSECLHFGRAAASLHLSQQGLSHRISRLEQDLGQQLFVRGSRTVELTPAGVRFLPRARELLNAAQAALAEVRQVSRPLRVDVWGQVHAPLRWIRRISDGRDLDVEITMRRGTGAAIDALLRDDIDVAFGLLPHSIGSRLSGVLSHRMVCLDRIGVLLGPGHPLYDAEVVRPADLRDGGLWLPRRATAPEIVEHAEQLAGQFGIPYDDSGINLGLDEVLAGLVQRPRAATLTPMDMSIPADSSIRRVPLSDPVPLYAWTMFWRADQHDLRVERLLRDITALGEAEGWPVFDPARHWLAPSDLIRMRGRTAAQGHPLS